MGKRILPWDWLEDTISAFHLGYQSRNGLISLLHPFLRDKMKNFESSNDRKIFEHPPKMFQLIFFVENFTLVRETRRLVKRWLPPTPWSSFLDRYNKWNMCLSRLSRALENFARKSSLSKLRCENYKRQVFVKVKKYQKVFIKIFMVFYLCDTPRFCYWNGLMIWQNFSRLCLWMTVRLRGTVWSSSVRTALPNTFTGWISPITGWHPSPSFILI